jgi:formiminoglutamase
MLAFLSVNARDNMFTPFTEKNLNTLLNRRDGETKLGQSLYLLDAQLPLADALAQAKHLGVRFALVGISEDIGPRANLGRGGAHDAFSASLSQWLNLQANRFYNAKDCTIVGQLVPPELADDAELAQLRQATEVLDTHVITLISTIITAGLEPIVIGGGHNNAFGLLMAAKASLGEPMAAINLDPHSDFRPKEGRHSGNGFSYAAANGALDYYHVLGLHELKNTEKTLEQLSLFGAKWHSFQQIWVRRELTLSEALKQIAKGLNSTQLPVALELDVDAISAMPSSASTFAGVPLSDALHYVYYIARHCPCAYLHLAEAAPMCHSAGVNAGYRDVGQGISELIYAYIQGRRC